jgi:hypothetical protein
MKAMHSGLSVIENAIIVEADRRQRDDRRQ